MPRRPEPMSYERRLSEARSFVDNENADGVLIVDCETQSDLLKFYEEFAGLDVVKPNEFCREDFPPQREALLERISKITQPTLFKHLSPFWRLKGKDEVKSTISTLLQARSRRPAIIVVYQLASFLTSITDPRILPRVLIVGAPEDEEPVESARLLFVNREYLHKGAKTKGTLDKLGEAVETAKYDRNKDTELVFTTKRRVADYPNSLLPINEIQDARSAIIRLAPELSAVDSRALEEDEWREVWREIVRVGSLNKAVESAFGGRGVQSLTKALEAREPFKRPVDFPLFFLALKLYAPRDASYLGRVVSETTRGADFFDNLYRLLLTIEPTAPEFKSLYDERRAMLGEDASEKIATARSRFLTAAIAKGADAAFYMTDRSSEERKAILKLLAQYGFELGRERVLAITKCVYPDLYDYLTSYPFEDDLLREYFKDYQFLKVVNRLTPEFLARVNHLAIARDFNARLPQRSTLLAQIDRTNARVCFIDALGVEFLSFLVARAREQKLSFDASVCRCVAPSTTDCNKDVEDFLNDEDWQMKVLDDIKHGRRNKTKSVERSTAYIEEELFELAGFVKMISEELNRGTVDRFYIVSDHGASRLAVLYEPTTKYEMKLKGERSGRCCRKEETDVQPEGAMDAGEWWAFANYERFKGSRKADVETHGGATLEEICTPVIELKLLDQTITATLGMLDEEGRFTEETSSKLEKSYKKTPTLYFRTSRRLKKPRIKIDGKDSNEPERVESLADAHVYRVVLPEANKGDHTAQVYDDAYPIGDGLTFTIVNAGVNKRSIL